MRRTGNRARAALALILIAATLEAAIAQAQTWTGGSATANNWTDATNWSSNPAAPVNDGTADILYSGTAPRTTSTVDINYDINTLTFDSTATGYTIDASGGSALTIEGGVTNNATNVQTISAPVTLGATQIWTVNTGAELDVNGAISGSAATLTLTGGGVLQLGSASNNFAAVVIDSGTMRQGMANGIADVGYTINGGTLDFNNLAGAVGSVNQTGGAIDFWVNNGGTQATNTVTFGNVTQSAGTIDMRGGTGTFASISQTGTGTFSTGTGGNASVTGTLTLNGTSQFSVDGGSATVGDLAGTSSTAILNLGAGAFTDNIASGADTYAGTIQSTAGGKLILNGSTSAASLTLTGNNTSTFVAGTMQINNGNTLIAGADNSLPTADYVFKGTGTLSAQGHNFAVTSLTDDGTGNASISLGSATMTIQNTTGTPVYTGKITGTTNGSTVPEILMSSGSQTLNGVISGSTQVAVNGGTLILGGANTYTGSTTVTGGTLQGTTTSLHGNITTTSPGNVDFNQTAGGTYTGALSGSGNVAIDANGNTVIFTGANSYTGNTTINSGTLQIGNGGTTGSLGGTPGVVTDNGTLAFDQSSTVTVANDISGSGILNQSGTGLVTLSGTDTYTGATNVNAGQLNVDGSITSATTVVSAATLGGIGTITGTVNNSGTITPGNSSNKEGTLTVNGNFSNAAGAKMNVSVDDTASQNVGKLAVTGSASVNNAKLNIDLSSGHFDRSGTTQYEFLTATGGVTGNFASATTSSLFVTATLHPEADDVFFTLNTNFTAVGATFNERQVGAYLDRNSANTNTAFQSVLTQLEGLTSQAAAQEALTQISGDIHPTMAQVAVNNTTIVVGQVAARLRGAPFAPGGPLSMADDGKPSRSSAAPIALVSEGPDGQPEIQCCPDQCSGNRWTGWGIGFGSGGSAKSDGNATGVSYGMGGVVAGLERWEDDCHLIGAYGAYIGSNVDATNDQNATLNGGQFGAYLFGDDGFNYYTLLGGVGFDGNTTNRTLTFMSPASANSSNTSDWQAFLYAERGVSLQSGNYVLQPFVGLQYLYLQQNGFTESGGNAALDLSGTSNTTNSLRSIVGARFQDAQINHSGLRTLPELHALWMHECLDSSSSVQTTMVPIGGAPFIVQGLDMGRDWAVLGGNYTWEMRNGWSMFVNYDLQFNSQATYNIGSGGVGYSW